MRMKSGVLAAVAVALFVSTAFASVPAQSEREDLQVFNDISKTVNGYVHFSIFDDVNVNLSHGVTTLTGKVTMPYKRDDIEKRVAKVDGVSQVVNHIEVLPVSSFDDDLRLRIARSIYG